MVRPSRPAPLMLDEPFMLFSGPCSAAEQGAGMLSPCSAADASPQPKAVTVGSNVIHVHPHTVAGSRAGGSHFNAPSPPRHHHVGQGQGQQHGKGAMHGGGSRIRIAESAQEPDDENHQLSWRSDASLEACLDLPQRPATTRARGGAFNGFFSKLSSSTNTSSTTNTTTLPASSSGGTTPASAGMSGGQTKKKKRAFPGFTPKGLVGGVAFSLSTPRQQSQQQAQGPPEKPSLAKHVSASAATSGSSPTPIFGTLTRGASFMSL
jgi:hypothetical protein